MYLVLTIVFNFCGQRLASTYVFMHLPLPLTFRPFLQIYMGKLDIETYLKPLLAFFSIITY